MPTAGVDYNEATKALAEHCQAAPGDTKPDPVPGENMIAHTRLPSTLTYDKDGTRVTAHFEGRVPVDPARPLVVWLVTYQLPWTPEQRRIEFMHGQQAVQRRL